MTLLLLLTQEDQPHESSVALANAADPAGVQDRLGVASQVRLEFPKWADGRAYSQARLLRQRFHYLGDIRATGDVVADMAPLLARCGFSSAVLRPGESRASAEQALRLVTVDFQPNYPKLQAGIQVHGTSSGEEPPHIARTLSLLQEAAACPGAVLATSMGVEDQVLAHLIARHGLGIELIAIDTGRLHAETLATLRMTEQRYGLRIKVVRPDAGATHEYVQQHGLNAFYESVDLRKRCCHIRKVEPLARALTGRTAWVTGQRREQALSRSALAEREIDTATGMKKFNPLATWTTDQVWAFANLHDVPVNPLHARGYPSIGCEPCTRAIKPREDIRAGRWWWEIKDANTSECGLHSTNAVSA
jgi:phosphoadenosine phosphosulfate reductase